MRAWHRLLKVIVLILLVIASSNPLQAQVGSVMPLPVQQFFDDSGDPLASGTLTFYAAGTTTPQNVYSDSALSTPLSNPLTLDADGRTATNVYLSNAGYKIVLKTSGGTTLWTADNVFSPGYIAVQAVTPAVQTSTATGAQNDFDLSCSSTANTICILRMNNASDTTFTGLEAMASGTRLIVVSVGAGNVYLTPESGSSTAANRLINFATVADTPLAAGYGRAVYVYDSTATRWRLVSHEQGAPITYTPTIGSGSGTFTTTSAAGRTYMSGRRVFVRIGIVITTNGTAATYITATLPYAAAAVGYQLSCLETVSTGVACTGQVSASGSSVAIRKYDGTYPGANGYTFVTSGFYEIP